MSINNSGQDTATSFDKCVNKKLTLTANNPAIVLPANSKREYSSLVLNSQGEVTLVFGALSTSRLGEGIPLVGKGSSYEINQSNLYRGQISAISSVTTELAIVECEKS